MLQLYGLKQAYSKYFYATFPYTSLPHVPACAQPLSTIRTEEDRGKAFVRYRLRPAPPCVFERYTQYCIEYVQEALWHEDLMKTYFV